MRRRLGGLRRDGLGSLGLLAGFVGPDLPSSLLEHVDGPAALARELGNLVRPEQDEPHDQNNDISPMLKSPILPHLSRRL